MNSLLAIAFSLVYSEFPLTAPDTTKLATFCARCGQQYEARYCPRCGDEDYMIVFSVLWLEVLKRGFEERAERTLTEEEFNRELEEMTQRMWDLYRGPDFYQSLLALPFLLNAWTIRGQRNGS